MARSPELRLQLTRVVAASRERVFRAWTDPGELRRWFRAEPGFVVTIAEVDLRVGGRYRLAMKPEEKDAFVVGGTYLEIRPPERLVFTWRWEGSGDPEELVILELRDRDGQTEVVLTHERLPSEEQRESHQKGWIGCLDQLAAMLAES